MSREHVYAISNGNENGEKIPFQPKKEMILEKWVKVRKTTYLSLRRPVALSCALCTTIFVLWCVLRTGTSISWLSHEPLAMPPLVLMTA